MWQRAYLRGRDILRAKLRSTSNLTMARCHSKYLYIGCLGNRGSHPLAPDGFVSRLFSGINGKAVYMNHLALVTKLGTLTDDNELGSCKVTLQRRGWQVLLQLEFFFFFFQKKMFL